MKEEEETYQFHGAILLRAESAEEFERGLQVLLERKPKKAKLKEYIPKFIPVILGATPTHLLSYRVYEMFSNYPNIVLFAAAFLRIASISEIGLRMKIVDRVKRIEGLDDHILCNLMALEMGVGEFESARQTFCSIKTPKGKTKAGAQLSFFIEKENWIHFDIFYKELYMFFDQKSRIWEEEKECVFELIKKIAERDVERALNIVKGYCTGFSLASFMVIIAEEQKKQKLNFLPLVFEARSLITSLVPDEPVQALFLLKKLLELQSDDRPYAQ